MIEIFTKVSKTEDLRQAKINFDSCARAGIGDGRRNVSPESLNRWSDRDLLVKLKGIGPRMGRKGRRLGERSKFWGRGTGPNKIPDVAIGRELVSAAAISSAGTATDEPTVFSPPI